MICSADENLKKDISSLLDLKEIVKDKVIGSEAEYPFFPIIIKYGIYLSTCSS
jgi:hypothetical protein